MKFISTLISIFFCLGFITSSWAQLPINFIPANNNTTINTCNGFIIDSGGQGGPGYGNGENVTITICPDTPGEIISIDFTLFDLSTFNTGTQQNPTLDYMYVFDGPTTASNSLGVYSGNGLQSVIIQATVLNPSGCITLMFTSNSSGTGFFAASVSCETPCANPQASGILLSGITNDSIHVCIGDTVNFQNQGSFAQQGFTLSNYMWDFMDGDTANGQFVSHSFNTPGLYSVQLFVTDDNGCSNPNLIDLHVLVGTVPNFINFPTDTSICLGESATFIGDVETVLWNGFPGSMSVDDGCLPDTLLGVSQDIQLMQTGFYSGSVIANVNDIESVCLDLEHSYMGDLVIIIECPNGQSAILHQQGGAGTQIGIPVQADNVDCSDPLTMGTPFTYCFTPSSTETWVEWVTNNPGINTIPAGNYESIDPLTNLVGCPTNGVWTLTVIDNWAADDGTLFSFGLTLDSSYYPPISTFQPSIGNQSDSSYWFNPVFQTYMSPDANEIEVTPTQSGNFTYEYFVIDNFGCEYDTSVVLTVDPNPAVFAGNDTTLCNGSGLQLDGQLLGLFSNCDYVLTMEDTFGDTWNGNTLTITINGVSTNYTCSNNLIQIENLIIPNGATVTVIFNANGGFINECSYTLVDGNGVTIVSQGPNLAGATVDNFVATCVPDFVYEWSPSGSVSDSTIADPILIVSGQETLTFTTYPLGHPLCATTDTIVVSISATPYPGNDSIIEICSSTAPFDLFPFLGSGASVNGSWFDDLGNPVTMPYDPALLPTGDYTYVVDSNGCVDQAMITINEIITDITNSTTTEVFCNGGSNGSITITGNNFIEYTIDGGASIAATSPFTITGLAAGNYTIDVYSLDGCSAQEIVIVSEPTAITFIEAVTSASCFSFCDGTVQITPSGGVGPYSYTWTAGVVGDQNGNGAAICAGIYDVTVTDANLCSSQIQFEVTEPAGVSPSIMGDVLSGCFPHQVNFTNTTPGNNILTTEVDFGDGSTLSVNGTLPVHHLYQDPGLYDVTIVVTTNDGCVFTVVYTNLINIYNSPNANFTVNPNFVSMLEPEVGLINQSSNDVVSWSWEITSGFPSTSTSENVIGVLYPFDSPGQYPVTLHVINANGCTDSITKYVTIINDVLLFAPNTFTPDGDEFNQTWEVHISGIDIYDFDLLLFNRWGEVIWESHDPSIGWDGTYNGKMVQDGTYNWQLRCSDIVNDNKYTFEGSVNVIK